MHQWDSVATRLQQPNTQVLQTYFVDGIALANFLPLEVLAAPQNADLQQSKQTLLSCQLLMMSSLQLAQNCILTVSVH